MKAIVTGGSGLVGRYVIQDLLEHRIDVINLDLLPSTNHPQVPFLRADLTNMVEAKAAIKDVDAVIHLAAIPNPFNDPAEKLMSVNMVITYNVLEAVRENRIRRIVYGCSESASGFGIHRVEHLPLYVPIDEKHPCWPHEVYSFTKYLGEVMCQEYARADKIEVIALRYGWVWFREHREQLLKTVAQRGDEAVQRLFGAYVFAEDVAQACRLALKYELPDAAMPFDAFYIMADEPLYTCPTLEAIRRAFGDKMPPVKPANYFRHNPRACAFNIGKAKRRLGYRPKCLCTDI